MLGLPPVLRSVLLRIASIDASGFDEGDEGGGGKDGRERTMRAASNTSAIHAWRCPRRVGSRTIVAFGAPLERTEEGFIDAFICPTMTY